MANQEQLSILKQGVDIWNKWRTENPQVKVDLTRALLIGTNLNHANLSGGNLEFSDLSTIFHDDYSVIAETNLVGADLKDATLTSANLAHSDFSHADLTNAELFFAILTGTQFNDANLTNAKLGWALLEGANLSNASLNGAELRNASLKFNNLTNTDMTGVHAGSTFFGSVDLSTVIGLDKILHLGPSTISVDTISNFRGKFPDVFLAGCGLSDWEIESAKLYSPNLSNDEFINIQNRIFDLRQRQALQISSLFISYSHADSAFVDKIDDYLNQKGIRFWRDVHDATSGQLEKQIDRAIRQNPTVLLILSGSSMNSDWVEHEVRTARQLEKELGHDVLCPLALDESWKHSSWEKRIMEQVMKYNILDFSEWKDDTKFEGAFKKLIDGLELFYK